MHLLPALSRLLFSGCLLLTLSTRAAQNFAPAGTLLNPTNNYTWNRMSTINVLSGQIVPFIAYQFYTTNSPAGNYTFTMNTVGFAGTINLYQNSFDPTQPGVNFWDNGVVAGGPGPVSKTFFVSAGSSFFVVFSAVATGSTGTYSATISGPGNVVIINDNKTQIVVPPVNTTISSGNSANLSVYAIGPLPHTWQWYGGPRPNSTLPIPGATSPNFNTGPLISSTSYWVRVTGPGNSGSVTSGTVNVTVTGNPNANYSGNLTPGGCTLPNGDIYAVQPFQIQQQGNYAFNLSPGFTATTYQGGFIPENPIANRWGYLNGNYPVGTFELVISKASPGGTYSGAIGGGPAIVNLLTPTPPVFTQQPYDTTILPGQTATLAVRTSCGTPFSLQWFRGPAGNTNTPIGGATGFTYTTPALTSNTTFWVRMVGPSTTNNSTAATVFMGTNPMKQSGELTGCDRTFNRPATISTLSGQNCFYKTFVYRVSTSGSYSFSLAATGFAGRLQLYTPSFPTNSPLVNLVAVTGTNLSFNHTAGTDFYRLVVSGTSAGEVGSFGVTQSGGPALVTLYPAPTITTQPAGTNVVRGQTATLRVANVTNGVSYQWFAGPACGTRFPISNATSIAFTTPAVTDYTNYWVELTSLGGYVVSQPALVGITPQATNDSGVTSEDVPLVVAAPGLLGNDTKAPSRTLTPVNVSTPAHGNVVVQPNGGFTYTPAANYHGPDSFTYRAFDGTATSAVATVSLSIVPVADTPQVTPAVTGLGMMTTNGLVISRNAADGPEVTHFKITGIQNGRLFQNNGTTPIADGEFITAAQGGAGLRFLPALGQATPTSPFGFNVRSSTNATDAGLGGATVAASVTVLVNMDWGDAPTAAQSGFTFNYPTTAVLDGARHITPSALFLGPVAGDAETNGIPQVEAHGDNLNGTNDETGVQLPAQFVRNQTVTLTVTATGVGRLDAWIDWNRNGSWGEAGEQIFTNRNVAAGANTLAVLVPALTNGGASFARFRLSSVGGLAPTGQANDGEVEDYRVSLVALTAPVVVTTTASGVLADQATLNGSVNPGGDPTVAFFEYGPTPALGSNTPAGNLAAVANPLPVSATLSGLRAGTTLHFRAAASNSMGLTFGDILTVTTAPLQFTGQPVGTIACPGGTARFSAGVNAVAPTFQWQRRNAGQAEFTHLPGATGSVLDIAPVTAADDGAAYRVVVTAAGTSVTSTEAVLLVISAISPVATYDFNSGRPANTALYGSAFIGGGVLELTPNLLNQAGAFLTTDLAPGRLVRGFSATFRARIDYGSFPPADGFSFCWATDLPNGTFPLGEEGAGSGLRIAFDTFDNGGLEAPAIDVFWNNNLIAHQPVAIEFLVRGPNFFDVQIRLTPDGLLDLNYACQPVFVRLPVTGYTPLMTARFGLGGRTGGLRESHGIDDLAIALNLDPTSGVPRITNVVTQVPTGLLLSGTGASNQNVAIEVSTNLVTWTRRAGATVNSGGLWQFLEPAIGAPPYQFYRLQSAPQFPAGLIDWWSAEGGYLDPIGGLNGAATGAPGFVAGQRGQAFDFNGTTQSLSLGGPPVPLPWTACFWVNRQNALVSSAALLGDGATALKLEQFGSPTRALGFTRFGVADYAFTNTVPTNAWSHVAFTATPAGTILYFNGVAAATNPATMNLPRGFLGSAAGGVDRMKGQLDEILLFNRALTPAEIQQVHNATRGP